LIDHFSDPFDVRIFLTLDKHDHEAYSIVVYALVGDEWKHLALRRGDIDQFCEMYSKDISHIGHTAIEMSLSVGDYALLLLRYVQ